jgi:hypothetical protein
MTYIAVLFCGEYEDYQNFNVYVGKSLDKAKKVMKKYDFKKVTWTDRNKGGYIEVWSKGKSIDIIDVKL